MTTARMSLLGTSRQFAADINSVAIGGEADMPRRRCHINPTRLTQLRHRTRNFAVMHNAAFPAAVW
jgi:hypothetical protein